MATNQQHLHIIGTQPPPHELHVNPHLRQGGGEREVACVLLR